MFTDLVLKRRRYDADRDTLHAIWLVKVGIDAVQMFVVGLQLVVCTFLDVLEMSDAFFKVPKRACIRFALECRMGGKLHIDPGQHFVNCFEVFIQLDVGLIQPVIESQPFAAGITQHIPLFLQPSTKMIQKVEDGLQRREA
jgi:hypothetical protein